MGETDNDTLILCLLLLCFLQDVEIFYQICALYVFFSLSDTLLKTISLLLWADDWERWPAHLEDEAL